MTSVPQRQRLREAVRLQRRPAVAHAGFLAGEVFLGALLAGLCFTVKAHPGPLPGDVAAELDVQHSLLPHRLLTDGIEALSTLNWPVPSAMTLAAIVALSLLLRRWLDTAAVILTAALCSATNARLSQFIHRPRPSGHGIHVLSVIKSTYSFPSGHVVYATAVFGLFLFLTYQVRRPVHPALLWAIRAVAAAVILLMPVSRVLEGEHWPSDVLAGVLFGALWLVAMSHVYLWARHRWPWTLAPDER